MDELDDELEFGLMVAILRGVVWNCLGEEAERLVLCWRVWLAVRVARGKVSKMVGGMAWRKDCIEGGRDFLE